MGSTLMEKASSYDKNGLMKTEIDNALTLLKDFRTRFPFAENPESIDSLSQNDIFKLETDELGAFFHFLEFYLKPLGHLTIRGSIVYQNIGKQIEDFKDLLRIAVDKKKSLAEKVDAKWEKISRLGQDKHIAKKIIFCFNYESGEVLPIFSTAHLRYFVNQFSNKPNSPPKYCSLGEEYEYLTNELLKIKDNTPITANWEITHFARFLYNCYPPPGRDEYITNKSSETKAKNIVTKEQLDLGEFSKQLATLQSKGKITGQQFREYRDQWTRQPADREALTQRLKALIS